MILRSLRLQSLENRQMLTALADVDLDGDLDIITARKWYENRDGYGNLNEHSLGLRLGHGFVVGDLDGDGDMDIVDKAGWKENRDGQGDFVSKQQFDLANFVLSQAKLGDVGADGDLDVLLFAENRVVMMENTGSGEFRKSADAIVAGLQDAGDIDNDGDLDLLALDRSSIPFTTWLYVNENGTFEKTMWHRDADPADDPHFAHFIPQTSSVHFAEMNNDGQLDIVAITGADGSFSLHYSVLSDNIENAGRKTLARCFGCHYKLADFDFDGDADLLESELNLLTTLIENDDGIRANRLSSFFVHGTVAGDLNGDGVIDSINEDSPTIWYDGKTGLAHEQGTIPPPKPSALVAFVQK